MTVNAKFDHSVEAVFKALTDPEFLIKRNLSIGEISAEYDKEEDGEETTLHAVRKARRKNTLPLPKWEQQVSTMVGSIPSDEQAHW
jgi:hypothetical protein